MRIQSSSTPASANADAAKIRAQLQAELLKRSVGKQQDETQQVQTNQKGLGQNLDIRV
jgi:hypothetical protein